MTTVALMPAQFLTAGDYAALGEDQQGRTELMEGNLVMSPSPTPDHNVGMLRLVFQLQPQLPGRYECIPDIDVDLQLAAPDAPGTVRRPDLVVADRRARRRVRAEGGLLRASDLLVVVEILSPGSQRIDRLVKRAEYADAGIAHYWIIDQEQHSLTAHRLVDAQFQADDPAVGSFRTDTPFPVTLDLADLE